MRRMTVLGAAMAAAMLGGAVPATAQMGSRGMTSMKDAQVADLQTMKDKFTSLGAAFSEEQFSWKPMDGTRSVKDVLVLMSVEGNLFPTMWGGTAAMGAGANFREETARLNAMSRTELLAEVGKAFDNIIGQAKGMDDDARMKPVKFFGQDTNAAGAVFMAQSDMHEHLGQLIVYARANQIVPPWSRQQG